MNSTPLRHTSIHDDHVALGARMVPYSGWDMPVQYAGIVTEHHAVRTAAGIFDVSHMGQLRLRGPHSQRVVDRLVTNDVKALGDGAATYTCACNERGTILDDLIVYRRSQDDWLVVCNSSNAVKMSAHFASAAAAECSFEDESPSTSLVALQGPRSFDILARLGPEGARVSELKSFHFRDTNLAGVRCTVARTGYTGEDGVEVFCAWDDGLALWRALLEAGRTLGCQPIGLGARDTLRLEARLALYGNDIDETTNPIEAGLGWVVKVDKGDFIGRTALMQARAQPPTRRLVGFEVTGRGIARHGYVLRDASGRAIGVCTSGSPAPTVGKNIGLGYLEAATSVLGTQFFVDCRGKNIEAVVVKTPFYSRAATGG
jgi:aminomethyltransferase